jgi:hypothetical protein
MLNLIVSYYLSTSRTFTCKILYMYTLVICAWNSIGWTTHGWGLQGHVLTILLLIKNQGWLSTPTWHSSFGGFVQKWTMYIFICRDSALHKLAEANKYARDTLKDNNATRLQTHNFSIMTMHYKYGNCSLVFLYLQVNIVLFCWNEGREGKPNFQCICSLVQYRSACLIMLIDSIHRWYSDLWFMCTISSSSAAWTDVSLHEVAQCMQSYRLQLNNDKMEAMWSNVVCI